MSPFQGLLLQPNPYSQGGALSYAGMPFQGEKAAATRRARPGLGRGRGEASLLHKERKSEAPRPAQ